MKRENEQLTSSITLLLDIISILVSFFLAGYIRGGILRPGFSKGIYGNLLIVLVLSVVIINYAGGHNKKIFKRGYFEELVSIIKDQGKLALIIFGYMFAVQESVFFSRIFLLLIFSFNILIIYVLRSYMKIIILIGYMNSSSNNKVMLVTTSENVSEIIQKMRREYDWQICVTSIAIWDMDRIGDVIEGIEVVANRENLFEMAKQNVVDEVFINIPRTYKLNLEELVLEYEKMGITVHINLDIFGNMRLKKKTINEYGGHHVITFSCVLFDTKHAIIKRSVDIIGGFIGCILTIILTAFLAPAIIIESKGPIFFSQTRVGKNGRRFKIYKFRSMYLDAEHRKNELMEQNEMTGLMFKMRDDPRITKIGKFIRKTSLDEFPQFFNVLIGDMSLVGTRPPTEDEFLQYEGWHKRRLCLKPGLTGLWQVSGRSDITNFEEVVKMDLEYIDNWSILLDLKLILKTVVVMLTGRGSR